MCVISMVLGWAMAYPLSLSDRLKIKSSEKDDKSDDYVDRMIDIFGLPLENDGHINLENCKNVMCMPHYLCINDMVVTNGTELFEWRISLRSNMEKRAVNLVCGDMEMPCCADEAMKNLHTTTTEGDQSSTSEEDYVDENEVINAGQSEGKCGFRLQQNQNPTSARIINGDEAQPNEFPWVVGVFLRLKTEHLRYVGGGSLIHESAVLTAAHLLLQYRPEELVIRAGEHDILDTTADSKRQERNVTNIIFHDSLHAQSLINDIAIVTLDIPFKLTETVNAVCLPPQSVQTDENIMCTSSGWGKNAADRHGKYQATLKKVELPIVDRGKCENLLRKTRLGPFYNLHGSLMCAGGGRRDTCKGDGGSPLFCEIPHDKGRFYQTGIVAGGIGCGRNIPGLYVNIAHFTNWISQQLGFIKLYMKPQNILQYELFD